MEVNFFGVRVIEKEKRGIFKQLWVLPYSSRSQVSRKEKKPKIGSTS